MSSRARQLHQGFDDLHQGEESDGTMRSPGGFAPWLLLLQSAGGAGNAFAGDLMRGGQESAPSRPTNSFRRATLGGGGPIPFQQEMESAFGEDFSSVRCHFGQRDALDGLQANAAADGERVVFGEASPDRELVAHELAHVVQQRRGTGSGSGAEAEAERAGREATSGRPVSSVRASAPGIHRDPMDPHPERVSMAINRATAARDLAALDGIVSALHRAEGESGVAVSGLPEPLGPRLATVRLPDQNVVVMQSDLGALLSQTEQARGTIRERMARDSAPAAPREAGDSAVRGGASAHGVHRDSQQPHPERVTAAISAATQARDLEALDRIESAIHDAATASGEARSGGDAVGEPRLATVCLSGRPVLVLATDLSHLAEEAQSARDIVLRRQREAETHNQCGPSPACYTPSPMTPQAQPERAIPAGTTYTFPEDTIVNGQVFEVAAQGTARNIISEYVSARVAYLSQLKDRETNAIDNFVMGQQFSTSADAEPNVLQAIIGSEAVSLLGSVEEGISTRLETAFQISNELAGQMIGMVTRGLGALRAINAELERANLASGSFTQRDFAAGLRDHIEQQYGSRIMATATEGTDAYAWQFDRLEGTFNPATGNTPARYTGAKARFLRAIRTATTDLNSLSAIPSVGQFQQRFIERWISRFGPAQGGQIDISCDVEPNGDSFVFTLGSAATISGVARAANVADQLTRTMRGLGRRVYQLGIPVLVALPGPNVSGGETTWHFRLDRREAPDPSRSLTGFEPADARWRAFCQQRTLDRIVDVQSS